MQDQTENLENLENLINFFDEFNKEERLVKEQLTDFEKIEMFKINFTFCHIAISRNGGLIAICKKRKFLDMSKGAVLNNNIIVMHQDGIQRYYLEINWNYNKRFIICLDFTPKEDLYGILNDGSIIKLKYYERKIKEILSPQNLREEGIVKAKFFQKGFIAFTKLKNFYYIKDFKNPIALLLCSFMNMIKLSFKLDFLIIPQDNSSSGRIELLITRKNDDNETGVIQIYQKEEGQNIQFKILDENYSELLGASIILREKPQKFIVSNEVYSLKNNVGDKKIDGKNEEYEEEEEEDEDDEKIKKKKELENEKEKKKKKKKKGKKDKDKDIPPLPKFGDEGEQNEIGVISALAISPSGEKIAFYNKEKQIAFLLNSDFRGHYKVIKFEYDRNNYSDLENKEIENLLKYKKGCQFLFCGEDIIALSRQRFIILAKPDEKPLIYLIYEGGESQVKFKTLFSRCITEVDGLRYLTNEGVFLINKVPKELYNICHPFSHSPSKKLIQIYKNYLLRKYNSDKDIRSLNNVLSSAIENIQNASAYLFWTENNNKDFKKEIQYFILKAAQYAKKFVNKEDFNYDKFNEICKEMRIVNNLRNHKKYPIFITFLEYKNSNPKEIITKLIKYKNFKLAYEISKFLEYETKKVLHKYVISIMKKEIDNIEITFGKPLKSKGKEIEDENEKSMKEKYERLFNNLEKVPGISYIKLAKKASKLGGEKLAMHLIEQEKSALIKIPQLLQLKDQKLEEAIHIAFETYDFNAVIKVLYKIIKNGKMNLLTHNNLQKYFPKILLYLKKYDKESIKGFLEETKKSSQIFYLEFNKYFKENTSDGRNAKIDKCKGLYKKIDNDSNFDNKFVKKYLEKMKYSIEFKKECQKPERNIIHYSELEPYSVSIYDCYKNGIMKEKANWVESENKTFDYSNKKFNLLKLRSYLELKRPDAIERQLEKTSLKKLGLNPMHLAEIYFDYKYYDKATEYLMQVREPFYFSYVVDILKNMNKFKEALEVIIAAKDIEGKEIMINEILRKEPKLQKYVDEFCSKYKASIQL